MAVDELPMVQLDYTFIDGVTVLDMYVTEVRCGAGTVVEKKGVTKFAVMAKKPLTHNLGCDTTYPPAASM